MRARAAWAASFIFGGMIAVSLLGGKATGIDGRHQFVPGQGTIAAVEGATVHAPVAFDLTTREEAPIRFEAWLGQRSRWMKGWMQTWGVHMREPRRLWREAGPRGFLTLNIIVGGNVLTALAYPILVVEVAAYLATTGAGIMPGGFFTGSLAPLHIATVAAGFLATVVVGLMGLARRGKLRIGRVLALTPLYWACLSIAAWRALWQLWRDPYRWEKTEHGLTQTRAAVTSPRALATTHPHRRSDPSRAKRNWTN